MTVEKTTSKNVPVLHSTCNAGPAPQTLQRNSLVGPAHPPHHGLCNAGLIPLSLQRNAIPASQNGPCNAGLQTLQRNPSAVQEPCNARPRTINPDWHVN